MAALGRRERAINIWPGFVDALATLLLVIIFLLLIFVLAQFFMNEALSGRDSALDRLRGQLTELADLLALERKAQKNLNDNLAQLSAELQTSVAMRDDLRASINAMRMSAEETEARLSAQLLAANDALNQANKAREDLRASINDMRMSAEETEARLSAQLSAANDALGQANKAREDDRHTFQALLAEAKQAWEEERQAFLSQLDETKQAHEKQRQGLETKLKDAQALSEVAERKLKEQIKLISELNHNITGLKALRDELEAKISELAAKAEVSDKALASNKKKLLEERHLSKSVQAAAERKLKKQIKLISELNHDIAALKALRDELEAKISELATKAGVTDKALASNKKKLLEEKQLSKSARAEVALLNKQMATLRAQLSKIQAALEVSEKLTTDQKVQIVNLGKRLNAALASKVQELSRYRSEFFGRLRDVLGRQQGLRIVGDRFVFQSEVLFDKGSDYIGPSGQSQLTTLAVTLNEISTKIPKDIDWVLRIDGHTDSDPIKTARFPSNWELSSARAIAVVQKLIEQGLPANRLVAAGFGQFQPIDASQDEIAKRRNRRIELKLTQR